MARLLGVRPEEGGLAALVGLLFLCLKAGQGMADNAASALFFLRFGVDNLPYMYFLLGGLTFLFTLAYVAALVRFGRRRFFGLLIASLAILLLVEWIALLHPFLLLYPVVWLTLNCFGTIVGTLVWNLAGEVSDARQAKRLFPLFASAGILGSVIGDFATGVVARRLGTSSLLLLDAGLMVGGYLVTQAISHRYFRPVTVSGRRADVLTDLRSGLDFVRGSRLMQLAAVASILFSILFFSMAFPFSRVVAAAFPDEAGVAGFLGLFNGVTTATTFLVSLVLANRLYARLGIVNSILLMPAAYAFAFVAFAARYTLAGGIVARFAQMLVLGGVASTAWNALFNVVPSHKRGQVLAFQSGVPTQVGVAVSGLLLILGRRVLTPTEILLMGMVVTLACAWIVWRMRASYGEALLHALRAGRLEVFSAAATGFAGLQGDAAALEVVTRASRDIKPDTRYLAAEIIGSMQNPLAIPALRKALKDTDARVRAAALRSLGELWARSAGADIVALLDDLDPEVRLQALRALERLEVVAGPALQRLLAERLEDSSLPVKLQALQMLAGCGGQQVVLSSLMKMLQSGHPDEEIGSLEVVGSLALSLGSQLDPAYISSYTSRPETGIRVAACHALAGFRDSESEAALVTCLSDSQAAVRFTAAKVLVQRGESGLHAALAALGTGGDEVVDAVLQSLPSGNEHVATPLRSLARRQLDRLRKLRAQEMSLPAAGRATMLLKAELRREAGLVEGRILQILGLMGDPATMALVSRALRAGDPESRGAAIEALDTVGDKVLRQEIVASLEMGFQGGDSVGMIRQMIEEGDRWKRALAIRSSQELDLREFLPALRGLDLDPDPLIQETAREALSDFDEVKQMKTLETVSLMERVLLLREVPIFAELSPEDLQQIAELAREQWFPTNSLVFSEGDDGDMLYVVVEGRLEVSRTSNGTTRIIAQRGRGDFVGEMAIIDAAPRSATLRTSEDSRLLEIGGDTFRGILAQRPEVALAVLRSLSRRLRESLA